MERTSSSRKRKVITKDVDTGTAAVPGAELDLSYLERLQSQEDDEDSDSDEAVDDYDQLSGDEESQASVSLGSEEILSDEDDLGSFVPKKSLDNAEERHRFTNIDAQLAAANEVDSWDEPDGLRFRVVKGADGNDRYVYDEIDINDDSEYSAGNDEQNTIGNIPLSFYDSYPHIGYNINGKKILRPAKGEALDALLDTIEVPKGWTGLTDPSTGKPLELSQDELELLRKVQGNEFAADAYDPYEPTVEYFTSKTETMPLSAAPEPKRRFLPSKHEAKRVMKIVRAIREGRILPYKPAKEEQEDEETQNYDLWVNEQSRPEHAMHMPAPKLPPPGFDESYHPPPEFLPDQKEQTAWEEADDEDRPKDYLPKDHLSLRKVPGYVKIVKERFERCLDLYLAPRIRRARLNIDPDSLLPKLPSPEELRPFPSQQTAVFVGHSGRVRSLAIDPSGLYLATGGDDGTVRVWTMFPPRQVWVTDFGIETPINVVRWRPGLNAFILAIAAGDDIYLTVPLPPDLTPDLEDVSRAILDSGWSSAMSDTKASSSTTWVRPSHRQQEDNVLVTIPLGYTAKSLSFHSAGNHIVTVCPSSTVPSSRHIAIHTMNSHRTQYPFTKRPRGGGPPQIAHFHPTRSIIYVANQRVIRAYDLSKQELIKIVQPGARWISSFDVHPTSSLTAGSENLLVASYDRRLLWMDLELSPRPYKTLRYHEKAIRVARFHVNTARFPLFADGSDDGSIQVFHGQVVGDAMSNARIVPLKVLKGHKISGGGLGIMDLDWHPSEAWLVSAGGDGVCRLWT